jgi:hypothetical protein
MMLFLSNYFGIQQMKNIKLLAQLYRRGIRVWGGAGCCLPLAAATSNPNGLSPLGLGLGEVQPSLVAASP